MQHFRSRKLSVFLVVLGALLGSTVACSSSVPTELPVRSAAVIAPPPLTLNLSAPTEVRSGESVPLSLVLTNSGTESIKLGLAGVEAQQSDFVVTTTDGREVWSKLHSTTLLDIELLRPLGPGEAITFAGSWNQRDNSSHLVPPGNYLVRGIVAEVEFSKSPGGIQSPSVPVTIR